MCMKFLSLYTLIYVLTVTNVMSVADTGVFDGESPLLATFDANANGALDREEIEKLRGEVNKLRSPDASSVAVEKGSSSDSQCGRCRRGGPKKGYCGEDGKNGPKGDCCSCEKCACCGGCRARKDWRARLMEKFDQNRDGTLDQRERMVLREKMHEKYKATGLPRRGSGCGGSSNPGWRPAPPAGGPAVDIHIRVTGMTGAVQRDHGGPSRGPRFGLDAREPSGLGESNELGEPKENERFDIHIPLNQIVADLFDHYGPLEETPSVGEPQEE